MVAERAWMQQPLIVYRERVMYRRTNVGKAVPMITSVLQVLIAMAVLAA